MSWLLVLQISLLMFTACFLVSLFVITTYNAMSDHDLRNEEEYIKYASDLGVKAPLYPEDL